ncbi:unnamed protein product [marine sediment metagenome]|uniref:Uncharacterized protein n=1 Tax=marine sediment metagenome TaxID=412755 RepID=X1UK39_9ZZZZ
MKTYQEFEAVRKLLNRWRLTDNIRLKVYVSNILHRTHIELFYLISCSFKS